MVETEQRWKWVSGSWVMGHWLPMTHDNEIACILLFIVDIKKLLTHSISPVIIAGGLILMY